MLDRRWWTRTAIAATGITATTTLAVGVAIGAGQGSARDLVPTSEEAAAATAVLGAEDGDGRGPDPELKAAREEARKLEGKEKREALKAVRDDVAAGKYGEQAQQRLEKQTERADRLRGRLPTELREDLAELRQKPEDERSEAREALRDKAREGGYGKGVKRIVTALG